MIHACGGGLDGHQRTVGAWLMCCDAAGQRAQAGRTFGTMTADLLTRIDWLTGAGCTHVAMASPGVDGPPVFNLWAGLCEVVVVKAPQVKARPGRQTEVNDAQWLAALLPHGWRRGSGVPSAAPRERRDLTRHRPTWVAERSRLVNRRQKVREDAKITGAAVVSEVTGVSARARLTAGLEGQTAPHRLAALAQGRRRSTRAPLEPALRGRLRPPQAVLLRAPVSPLASLDEAIERVSPAMAERLRRFAWAIDLLETIPGLSRRRAEIRLAERGPDLSRFPSGQHRAAWAGRCPGHHERAGQRHSGNTRQGSRGWRQVWREAAKRLGRSTQSSLAAQYRRWAARRGKKKAMVAVGPSRLVIADDVLTRPDPYRAWGPNSCDERDRQRVERRLVPRLERLGDAVELKPRGAGAWTPECRQPPTFSA
jgi:transposase